MLGVSFREWAVLLMVAWLILEVGLRPGKK